MDKCIEEFEKHYLSLPFHTEWSAQICLDACSFDVKQDAYLPKMDWISSNDADECVIYCCMLNTAYLSFKEQQKRIDELTVGCALQRDHIKGLEAELKKAWTKVDQEGHKNHELVMLFKFIKEHFEMNDLDKAMPRVYEELEQALKGGEV